MSAAGLGRNMSRARGAGDCRTGDHAGRGCGGWCGGRNGAGAPRGQEASAGARMIGRASGRRAIGLRRASAGRSGGGQEIAALVSYGRGRRMRSAEMRRRAGGSGRREVIGAIGGRGRGMGRRPGGRGRGWRNRGPLRGGWRDRGRGRALCGRTRRRDDGRHGRRMRRRSSPDRRGLLWRLDDRRRARLSWGRRPHLRMRHRRDAGSRIGGGLRRRARFGRRRGGRMLDRRGMERRRRRSRGGRPGCRRPRRLRRRALLVSGIEALRRGLREHEALRRRGRRDAGLRAERQ